MRFTNAQLADAIKELAPKYFVNRSAIETYKPSLTNRALERFFENLVKDVRAGKPEGTTFTTIAKLASAFDSVSTSMNKIPERLTKRLSKPETTFIDGVPVEFTFSGPREPGISEKQPLRRNDRLYIRARYRVLPDTAALNPAAREATTLSSDFIRVQPRQSLFLRKSRTIFAMLLLLAIASIPTVLVLRQRRDNAEAKNRNHLEAKRLIDEAIDALGGHPGTRYVEDPPGYDRRRSDLYEVARRKLDQAKVLEPTSTRAANAMGIYYLVTGDRQQAKVNYQHALLLDPTNEDALCNLGDICLMEDQLESAMSYYARSIEVAPNYAAAYVGQAAALMRRYMLWQPSVPVPDSRLLGSIAEYDQMLQEQTQSIYKDAAARRELLDKAETAAQRAIQLEPHMAAPYRVLGNILHAKRNFAAATQAYTTAIRLQPDDPYSHYDFGLELGGAHDYTAAVSQLVQAIRLNRNYTRAFAFLSFALHNAHREDLAVAALLETNRLAPNDERFSWLRKRVPAPPDVVATVNARAHAFDDDYAKFLLHELSP